MIKEYHHIHYFGEICQITLGKCDGTNRMITKRALYLQIDFRR